MDLNWLIRSSADPHKYSMAIKGALVAIMPIALYLTGIAEADFNAFVDAVVMIIYAVSSIIAALQVIFGVARKVKLGRWSAPE